MAINKIDWFDLPTLSGRGFWEIDQENREWMHRAIQNEYKYEPGALWYDEWAKHEIPISRNTVVATFSDPDFPAAKVTIEKMPLAKNDPRNPNPDAGAVSEYVVVSNKRRSKPVRSLTTAKINAENLHNRLINGLKRERDRLDQERCEAELEEIARVAANPLFGRF